MHKRVGDTLIEVTLAVGIFSMVAIAAAAVMSGGTSSAQTALETTLAREEIDTQAEALRFIHSAYLADENSGDEPYTELWQKITDNAITPENGTNSLDETVMKEFTEAPTSCQNVSENNSLNKYGFVINTKSLGKTNLENDANQEQFVDNVYINSGNSSDKFKNAVTYPHLVYNNDIFQHAEGIYVIAVKDPGTTNLVNEKGDVDPNQSGYYDFYIRTCWYGTSSETPSTISTVIRLYDPPEAVSRATPRVKIRYNDDSNGKATFEDKPSTIIAYAGDTVTLTRPQKDPKRFGWEFLGWYIGDTELFRQGQGDYSVNDISCANDGVCSYTAPNPLEESKTIVIKGMWKHIAHVIKYNLNGGKFGPNEPTECYLDVYKETSKCQISAIIPQYDESKSRDFSGYSTQEGSKEVVYQPGGEITNLPTEEPTEITLYAVWVYHPDTIILIDSSRSMSDMIYASKQAVINVTAETTLLYGKVALFEYNTYYANGVNMLCGFDGNDDNKCSASNISDKVGLIKSHSGYSENLPQALNAVIKSSNLDWTQNYSKTIIIITDEYLNNDSEINSITGKGGFIDAVNNSDYHLTPLNLYIVTTCSNNSSCNKKKYEELFKDKFTEQVNVNIIAIPNGYKDCNNNRTPDEQKTTCKNAINSVVNALQNAV